MKEKIELKVEAIQRLRVVLYGDDDLRSFDDVIHQILNDRDEFKANLEAEMELAYADPYCVRTYGRLTKKDIDMLQSVIITAYTNAGRKSWNSKKEWRELGARFGLELTE